jgi:hypothetical protein
MIRVSPRKLFPEGATGVAEGISNGKSHVNPCVVIQVIRDARQRIFDFFETGFT